LQGLTSTGRLVRLTGTQGLLLALCRRLRGVFWAIIGGICLLWFSRKQKPATIISNPGTDDSETTEAAEPLRQTLTQPSAAFILAHDLHEGQFEPAAASVATLPVALRAILSVHKHSIRTILVLNPLTGPKIRRVLIDTGRLPADVEWMEVPAAATLSEILRVAAVRTGRVEFINGTRSYRPNLFQRLHELGGVSAAIELVDSGRPIGLVALGREMADALLLSSTRVQPRRLIETAYPFRHPHLRDALRHVLGKT